MTAIRTDQSGATPDPLGRTEGSGTSWLQQQAQNIGKPQDRPQFGDRETGDNQADATTGGARPSVIMPGATAVPNQTGGSWFSSPRPTSVPFASFDTAIAYYDEQLDPAWAERIQLIAEFASGANASGRSLWEKAVRATSDPNRTGQRLTPLQWIQQYAVRIGFTSPDGTVNVDALKDRFGGGSSGGGGGAGRQPIPEADIRDLANQISMAMVGRGVSDKEFARILPKVRGFEGRADASSAGIQDVIEGIVGQNPQYLDYQKATTLMDWFDAALAGRLNSG